MTIIHDEFGPELVVEVYNPKLSMRGFLVVDNTALGPGKGGMRMTPTVSAEEVFRLARTMTWKNALAGIPFGGAKSGIVWSAGSDLKKKKLFVQAFARAIAPYIPKNYIAGPDVATGEREMQWFSEATHSWESATGKPANFCEHAGPSGAPKCGIPHEFGSTGFGVAVSTLELLRLMKVNVAGATVAIHGFGNVGTFAFRHLAEAGARVVALADSSGLFYNKEGFTLAAVSRIIEKRETLKGNLRASRISEEQFWALPVDVLIPASVTDVIHGKNKHLIRARAIVEAGNIPMRENIEEELYKKGVAIVPDFVANAGGVISSYAEYRGLSPKKMFSLVEDKVKTATRTVMGEALRRRAFPRAVALDLAVKRVRTKMATRKKIWG